MNKVSFTAYSVAIVCLLLAVIELIIKTSNWGAIAIVALVAAALLAVVGFAYKQRGTSSSLAAK